MVGNLRFDKESEDEQFNRLFNEALAAFRAETIEKRRQWDIYMEKRAILEAKWDQQLINCKVRAQTIEKRKAAAKVARKAKEEQRKKFGRMTKF